MTSTDHRASTHLDATTSRALRRTSALALGVELLVVIAVFVAFSTATGEPAAACAWCASNAFDEAVRRLLVAGDPRAAARWSHQLSMGLAPLLALGGVVAPALRARRGWHAAQNAAIVVNGFVLTTALADGVKKLTDRQRPGVLHGRAELIEAARVPLEFNLSFFSGDTAWAFVLAASAWAIAAGRGYASARWLAVACAAVAVGVAALRIAADMHWATDVLAGALAGTLVGVGLPALVHGRDDARAEGPVRG